MGKLDVQGDVKAVVLFDLSTTVTDATEGNEVDTSEYAGEAKVILQAIEDTSQAANKTLDVTLHAVATGETPAAGNEVATFPLITAANDGAAHTHADAVGVDLDAFPATKKFLAALVTNSNTFAGTLGVVALMGNPRNAPVTALASTD